MSFSRYENYKASGVEWLGLVPTEWDILPLKAIATCNDEVLSEGTDPDKSIEYVEISGVDEVLGIVVTTNLAFAAAPSRARRKVRHGDVLISTVRTYLRAIATVANPPTDLIASTGFAVIRPTAVRAEYLGYMLRCEFFMAEVIARSVGISYPAINFSDLMVLKGPVPSDAEQVSIARFLDLETRKIDALVEEQRRLIEVLKEKRQAVISHAVTKGLHPDAPMKDSGVAWLGKVPAHWSLMSMKRDIEFITSGARGWAENYADEGDLFLRIGNLTRDSIRLDLSDIQRIVVPSGADKARSQVRMRDILFSITAYLGSVAVVPRELGTAYVSQHVALVRPKIKHLLSEWIAYVALSYVGKTFLEMRGYGGTKVQLSLDDVVNLLVTVPPLTEQHLLVNFIERETMKVDELISQAGSAVSLLQERRSALISAAVTGKIDVRSKTIVAPPELALA